MLDVTARRASYDLLSTKSLVLRSLILLLLEEAFFIFSGAVCPAAQMPPVWHGHTHRGSTAQDPTKRRHSQEAHTASFLAKSITFVSAAF